MRWQDLVAEDAAEAVAVAAVLEAEAVEDSAAADGPAAALAAAPDPEAVFMADPEDSTHLPDPRDLPDPVDSITIHLWAASM